MSEDLKATAYHEAAHAVVAATCGVKIGDVLLVEDEPWIGDIRLQDKDGGKQLEPYAQLRVALAGVLGEEKFKRRRNIVNVTCSDDGPDIQISIDWSDGKRSEAEITRKDAILFRRAKRGDDALKMDIQKVVEVLNEPKCWSAIEEIATAVQKKQRQHFLLDANSVCGIVRKHMHIRVRPTAEDDEDVGLSAIRTLDPKKGDRGGC